MVLRSLMYALAIWAFVRARKAGYSAKDVPALLRGYARVVLLVGANLLQRVAGKV
jgi:hypothetical protein